MKRFFQGTYVGDVKKTNLLITKDCFLLGRQLNILIEILANLTKIYIFQFFTYFLILLKNKFFLILKYTFKSFPIFSINFSSLPAQYQSFSGHFSRLLQQRNPIYASQDYIDS